MLSLGSSLRYIRSEDFERMGAGFDALRYTVGAAEFLCGDEGSDAAHLCCSDTLLPELSRIRNGPDIPFCGHPVHYIIRTTDKKIAHKVVELLISTLYKKGRLLSRRYTEISPYAQQVETRDLTALYRRSAGASVILTLDSGELPEEEYATPAVDLGEILSLAKQVSTDVLTVLCMDKGDHSLYDDLQDAAHSMAFVDICENALTDEMALDYLKQLAAEKGVAAPVGLEKAVAAVEIPNVKSLNDAFVRWYDGYLRTCAYPAYSEISTAQRKAEAPSGSAYEQLMDMIGLEDAKTVLKNALDYFKAQKVFADIDGFSGRPSMHMVFTGNPGTAKTTAARLFARILYDNGVLSTGNFVEVGRSELVGKYVGWTAKAVKKAFSDARGGLLFIDEAYSLVDERRGSYGDEAINTIVQAMENCRSDVCVIFAGYPEEMEKFLERNPGLTSRIAFHVNFPDYGTEELMQISRHIARSKKREWSPEAESLLMDRFRSIPKGRHFGNGRYVRNLVEQATMNQASRLLRMGRDHVRPDDIRLLLSEDIAPEVVKNQKAVKIGFC